MLTVDELTLMVRLLRLGGGGLNVFERVVLRNALAKLQVMEEEARRRPTGRLTRAYPPVR